MKCKNCKSEMKPIAVHRTFWVGTKEITIFDIPAHTCPHCEKTTIPFFKMFKAKQYAWQASVPYVYFLEEELVSNKASMLIPF